jgi:hypothetical protein
MVWVRERTIPTETSACQVAAQLYSRGWVNPVADPLFFVVHGNRNRDPWICSQELWPLDHRELVTQFQVIKKYPHLVRNPKFQYRLLHSVTGPYFGAAEPNPHPYITLLQNSTLTSSYELMGPFSKNKNHKSISIVRNLSCLSCTQYNTTLHVSAIRPSSSVSCI